MTEAASGCRAKCALLVALCAVAASAIAQPSDRLAQAFNVQADGVLGAMVREGRSSFAEAVLVEDGRIVSAPAYGVEDPSSRTPVSLDATLIDLSSLRKLFIAVAIAQLVDRGVINGIDDPVNSYLEHYQLPKAFGRDVTIREVATHSAGFDHTELGGGSLESDPAKFFEQRFPGYVENPGHYSAYDSYGPKLLAYMVSEATGKPFVRYVEESILRPLGMEHTYLTAQAEPPAHRIVPFQPKSPRTISPGERLKSVAATQVDGPSVSTVGDMAKFMMALLGPDAGQRAITPRMRGLLLRIQQANGDGGSAHGLVFDAVRTGSKTLFVHGGVAVGSKCMMALDVERRVGMFYCYGDVRRRLDRDPTVFPLDYERVTDLMLSPLTACPAAPGDICRRFPPPQWHEAWNPFLGIYVGAARHHRGFMRLRTMLYPTLARIARADDTLSLDGVDGFVEVSPGVFGNPHHLETFSVIVGAQGGKTILSVSDRPSIYERIDSLSDDPYTLPRILATLIFVAFTGGLIVVLPAYRIDMRGRATVVAYGVVVGCGVVALFGFSAFGRRYWDGITWPLDIARVCAFLTVPAGAALVFEAARLVRQPSAGMARVGRVHYTLVAASSVLLVATLFTVGLLSFARVT